MLTLRSRVLALGAVLCSLACSSSPTGPQVLYSADPSSNQNPYPDGRLLGDGGLGSRPNAFVPFVPASVVAGGGATFKTYMQTLATTISGVTGFGNYGGILVPFSESINAASLSAFSYVALGSTPTAGPTARVTYNDSPPYAYVEPTLPLGQGAAYALVLSDSAQSAAGKPLVRSADFDAWAQGAGKAQVAQIAAVLSVAPAHIIFAMIFSTESSNQDLETLAAWVKQPLPAFGPDAGILIPSPPVVSCTAAPPNTQCPAGVFSLDAGNLSVITPWFTEAPADGGPAGGFQDPPVDVGTIVAGTVTLQDARDAENGHFQESVVQNPSTGRSVDRAFVLAMPNPATVPMPSGGYPLVLVGHGLGGRNSLSVDSMGNPTDSLCVTLAEFFAKAGYGCIGIDSPSHGTRGSEAQFFRFDDLTITRDYFREMAFDQMQILRVAASGQLAPYAPPIDASNLRYFGISLGGIMGSTFLSIDPRSVGGVLNVPGGGLVHIFQSPDIFYDLGLILQGSLGILFSSPDGGVDPSFQAVIPWVITNAQAIMEAADPINYAPTLPSYKHILMQEGLLDRTVPNNTTNDLAAAFGVSTLTTAQAQAGGVNGLWKFDLTKYGLDPTVLNPHLCFEYLPAVRQQVADYLAKDCAEILSE